MTTKDPRPNTLTGFALHIKGKLSRSSSPKANGNGTDKGKAAQRHEAKRLEKQEKAERQSRDVQRREDKLRHEEELAKEEDDEATYARYGDVAEPSELPSYPKDISTIDQLPTLAVGTDVAFRARIFTQRRLSPKLDFLLFRDQEFSVQGVLANASPHMIRWVQRLHPESLVHVTGCLKTPHQDVRSATVHNLEVEVFSLHVVNEAGHLPWSNYDAPESLHTRMQARVLDIRHPSNIAIFKIRSMIVRQFRRTLEDLDFIEIQTPKLQPAATESGSEVFKVNYFGRTAFLAQSPQLAKQMAISADLRKVFEVGPVFRAENSNTHRHLTEYTGLDVEMEITKDYHEVMMTVDKCLKNIFTAVQSMPELKVVRERFPSEDLVWLEETLVLPFPEGIQMLRDDGRDVAMEDLSTRDEIRLGQLVKAKYKTDYYILDKFPANARPFYTHKAEDPEFTNSYDIFVRGQEICTGGQRIHNAQLLRESMRAARIAEGDMVEYLAAFDLGPAPHGGAGLGLERVVMLLLNLGDVRNATLFHRDPKSLPARPPSLPHPEADTTKHWQYQEAPPIEKLIANYGDASNTSWLDPRFDIWRHPNGAAVGFGTQDDKFAMTIGDPLCDQSQYEEVISAYTKYVEKDLKLTPVWMLVSKEVEEILARNHKWRTLTCVEEQRINADHHKEPSKHDMSRVEREGIDVDEVHLNEDFKKRADKAIEEWKAARKEKGKQVHLTEIRPWVDSEHRRYFSAEKDGKVHALVVLAQLAPRHGWQVKWAMDFPGSPNGTIEVLVEKALSAVTGNVTFGVGVSEKLTPGNQLHGVRAKFLANTYEVIMKSLSLNKKAGFREKFGTFGEQVWICYPRYGVGVQDLKQFVRFFEDQE
ncbi:hypothetical protein JX265_000217 [Neoarthrinium moseri]|uniref:Probable aspartate--tRNA ligase, cytoplasmic n=1 Tax=Neoarthrinium moseri TaxID=1658444 RepID=A0A9P9WYD7_9PEZI|nr:uncharacterized protein JN550_001083 [Neoarthrinium moseri]KAI1853284.1 hypothetical protein JX266_001990 [Neoarthrinium moseri]KAI1877011.1 hypothetical protein JN550_001083 [Neoarthrinium moseri]KAI1881391.1 hypothetical protein JX265_000217 [Neoarthrinium moseri]